MDLMDRLRSQKTASTNPTLAPARKPTTRSPRKKRPTERQITLNVAATLQVANQGLMQFAPQFREDALTDQEVGMLARGLALEILDSERLLAYYMKVQTMGGGKHSVLTAACFAIAMPRLARHGILPEQVAIPLTVIALQVASGSPELDSNQGDKGPVPNGARTAHNHNGTDGEWEIGSGGSPLGFTSVPPDVPDETGRYVLVNGSGGQDGKAGSGRNARPESAPDRSLS